VIDETVIVENCFLILFRKLSMPSVIVGVLPIKPE
jgi:hypothetical protein